MVHLFVGHICWICFFVFCILLRKGQADGGGGRFPDNSEDDSLDNASCEIAPIVSDVPMKI